MSLQGQYVIREATMADIALIVTAIVEAEKSGTSKLGLSTLFNIPEKEVHTLVTRMLEEEIEGCEFSLSSFLVASDKGRAVAAVAGWVEGHNEDDLPSGLLRSNLIGYTFPEPALDHFKKNIGVISDLQLPRMKGALQIEYVYVKEQHRGKGCAAAIIERHVERSMLSTHPPELAQVQFFTNNFAAQIAYSKLGFEHARTVTSTNARTTDFLPHNEKTLYQKPLANG